jgi:hypothetical protein
MKIPTIIVSCALQHAQRQTQTRAGAMNTIRANRVTKYAEADRLRTWRIKMKSVVLQFVIISAVLCSLAAEAGAQCDPKSDPNQCLYSLLPQQPPPPPATDMQRLSPETAIKTAYDIAKGGMQNPTGEVMDVAIAAITVGYPPAGIALGIVKGLITAGSGGPDPVGEALKAINTRLSQMQNEFNQLQGTVRQIQNQQFKDENLSRSRWLTDLTDTIQRDSAVMATKPNDKEMVGMLVEAQQMASKFITDTDLWQWSDLRVHSDPTNSGALVADGMQPDFKALPALEHYATALALWMAELQYASHGDPGYITRNRQLVRDLLTHAAFLSVRPGWQRTSGVPALTLPEQVMYRSQCHVVLNSNQYVGAGQYPDPKTGLCYASIQCMDNQRHTYWALPQNEGQLQWASPRKTDVCTLSLGRHGESPSDGPEAEMASQNGVEAMTLLANQLRQLAKFGTLASQFIGQFDMTFYSKEALYGVKQNGELLWYSDIIGVDKNPPQQPQPITGNPMVNTPAGTSGRLGSYGAQPATSAVSRLSRSAGAPISASLSLPKIVHKWEGPKVVGTGWQGFRDVIPGGHTSFYGLTTDGSLLWYRHDGVMDGTPRWKGPVRVATGWNNYKAVFGGGDGILYGVGPDGSLNWYRRTDFDDATASTAPPTIGRNTGITRAYPGPLRAGIGVNTQASQGPLRIGTGFGNYTQIFSSGQGIIYAITPDGRLLWFRHTGFQTGAPQMLPPKQVGSGWANMKRVFSPGEGVIYAISKTGEVFWYKHDGYLDGSQRWQGPMKIAADWSTFTLVFPRMWGAPQAPAIH